MNNQILTLILNFFFMVIFNLANIIIMLGWGFAPPIIGVVLFLILILILFRKKNLCDTTYKRTIIAVSAISAKNGLDIHKELTGNSNSGNNSGNSSSSSGYTNTDDNSSSSSGNTNTNDNFSEANKAKNNNKKLHSFALPLILNFLGISFPSDNETNPFLTLITSVLILSIICLLCFINLIGYFSAIYFLRNNKYNLDIKYPRLNKILKYFERTSLFYAVIEGVIAIFCIISIISLCLLFLGIIIMK